MMASKNILLFICLLAFQSNHALDAEFRFTCPGAGNFPNPEDCSTFYSCATGSDPVLMDCPGDLLFDPTLKICNLAESVDCESNPPTTSDPSSSSQPTTSSSSSTSSPTTPTPSTSTTESTPTATIPTTSSTSPSTPTSEPPATTTGGPQFEPECPESGTATLENPEDCTSFFICIEGEYALIKCPPGYGYDPDSKDCQLAEEVGCETAVTPPSSSPVQCPSTGQSTIPNPTDCGSFFLCTDGKSSLITCAIGFEFNAVSEKCELPSTAGCSIPNDPSGPTQSTSPTSSTPVPPNGVPDCSSRPNGAVFPNPSDCTGFFQCSNGLIIANDCPPGLEFNAELSVCDRPENANCQEVVIYL